MVGANVVLAPWLPYSKAHSAGSLAIPTGYRIERDKEIQSQIEVKVWPQVDGIGGSNDAGDASIEKEVMSCMHRLQ
jgi:hypothetical protein